jgi:hypothetical protein
MGNEGNTWLNVPVETKETELTMVLPEILDKMATDMRTLTKYGDQMLL